MNVSSRFGVAGFGVIVTGGASGLGLAYGEVLAAHGARVTLIDVDGDAVEAEASRLRDEGLDVRGTVADVTDHPQLDQAIDEAAELYGRLDVAFANAGFGAKRGFLNESVEHWRSMVLTNVYGAALTIRATIEALTESRGHLLLTGSVAGRMVMRGSVYSATKWAVTGLGESARQELNGTGVRVTLIEPGAVDTPFFDTRPKAALQPDDVARAVMFAVSQPPEVDVNEILVRATAQDG